MSGPSVVVDGAPDGWTHIGGPGMHLLIGLEEDDEQTLAASDAADGGDLDDVIEVLTQGGMRRARHFVGVHWQPRTRLVAFGPVVAHVLLDDGSEHQVRATSTRVWTDVELAEHPAHVRLRVLDEHEAKEPAPPLTLGATGVPVGPLSPVPSTDRPYAAQPAPARGPAAGVAAEPTPGPNVERTQPRVEPAPERQVEPAPERQVEPAAPQPTRELPATVPTFGGTATAAPQASPWQRSWTQHSPTAGAAGAAEGSGEPKAPQPFAASGPATPSPEPEAVPPTTPSYDYLFGQTTTVDEHRRVLAELQGATDDEHDDEHADESSIERGDPVARFYPGPSHPSPHPLPQTPQHSPAAPAGRASPTPAASADASADGLISSVPWATPPRAAPDPVGRTGRTASGDDSDGDSGASTVAEPDVPTFTGRHTPPPAPTLLAPAAVPPPGARVPVAQPIITVGPPPLVAQDVAPPPEPLAAIEPAGRAAQPDRATGPPSDGADTDPVGVSDEETEQTVDRSALLQAREVARSQAANGPTVLAVLCSSSHPTAPHSERCRVCGASIPPQEPFAMPRPPLGVLRLSTGDVVTLDRSVLLGRAPRLADGYSAAERPHVVKVPSPERDVSRNHVEVLLEGWHVLVRDLGTTNGTTLTLPGGAPVRLRANDQQVLEAGALISMADEVSFVFETAP